MPASKSIGRKIIADLQEFIIFPPFLLNYRHTYPLTLSVSYGCKYWYRNQKKKLRNLAQFANAGAEKLSLCAQRQPGVG
jgi:hypothetical protein